MPAFTYGSYGSVLSKVYKDAMMCGQMGVVPFLDPEAIGGFPSLSLQIQIYICSLAAKGFSWQLAQMRVPALGLATLIKFACF